MQPPSQGISLVKSLLESIARGMTNPFVDKTIAIIAIVPFVYPIVRHFEMVGFDPPEIAYLVNTTLLACTMIFRRPPVRVTSNPLYWLTAFLASYWGFLVVGTLDPSIRVAPNWLTDGLAFFGLVIAIWSRVSLGRNIGFVPAQREIVSHGAYRYMRHPIYAGNFVTILGVFLAKCSWHNLAFFGIHIFLFAIKTLMEEDFLRKDPEYAAYMTRVRWRWIPGIA
jgi:protein-S-isoprenylcysteine O-methyltransferase Ste14